MTEARAAIRTDGVLEAIFAGERRRFKLPMFGELRLLQDKHDIGPVGFEVLFRGMSWKADHVFDVIKYALIGGGMPDADAQTLCEASITEGKLLQHAELAHNIILVTLGPLEPDDEKKPEAAAAAEASQ